MQAQLLGLLSDLREQFACSVLLITHDLAVAAQITDRIAVLYAGRVAEIGRTPEVLGHPSHPYTEGLLGSRLSLHTTRDSTLPTLPAETAPADERLRGCAYHSRCPLAIERCASEQPPLEPIGTGLNTAAGHLRACWREVHAVDDTIVRADEVPADGLSAELNSATATSQRSTTGEEPVVELRGLQCDFQTKSGFGPKHTVHALRGIDLNIQSGEALSIVGESGSGKSTLLRILAGLTEPTGGTALVRGSVQMVFQDAGSSLTPWMRVGDLLRERLSPLHLKRNEANARLEQTLAVMGLPDSVLSARPSELSGGQRQRVALARATVGAAGGAAVRRAHERARRVAGRDRIELDPRYAPRACHGRGVRDPRPCRRPADGRPHCGDGRRPAGRGRTRP